MPTNPTHPTNTTNPARAADPAHATDTTDSARATGPGATAEPSNTTGPGATAEPADTTNGPAHATDTTDPTRATSPGATAEPADSAGPGATAEPADTTNAPTGPADPPRLGVQKTYKLYLGGGFPRSESGRSYPITAADGGFLAHAAQASRKDARDAVTAAGKAWPGWAGRTGYNRGQILYRIAEMLETRRDQFTSEIAAIEGSTPKTAARQVEETIDRWVYYAGWADKLPQVLGASNPVAGPYFNFSTPEPLGTVAIIAPQTSSLLGLTSLLAPALTTGNTTVVLASQQRPLPAVTLTEVLATSDLPAGVVNLLTGHTTEIAPWLASHMDIKAIHLSGITDPTLATDLEHAAADNLKHLHRPHQPEPDWTQPPDLTLLRANLETKTVWHPIGT